MSVEFVKETAELFKVLGDFTRLKIVNSLKEKELSVHQISEAVEISQSLTSHQLKKLKDYGIVKSRKEGITNYYSIKDNHVLEIYLNALEHVSECN